jgi:hypothetical protein
MTQELIANLLRVHRKGITSLPVTCTHLYVCLRTDPLSFECYNFVSFLSKLRFDIWDRASNLLLEPPCNSPERSTKLFSQRPQPIYLSGYRILRCNLCIPMGAWVTLVQALKLKEEKWRSQKALFRCSSY